MAIVKLDSHIRDPYWPLGGLPQQMSTESISVDEFQALEQKVLQTVEIIKKEREARHLAEAERDAALTQVSHLREQVDSLTATSEGKHIELETLKSERQSVKTRVERMIAQMDELL